MSGSDVDGFEIDPARLAIVAIVAEYLANAAHDFAVAAGSATPPKPWAGLSRLEQNLRLAGLIGLARHERPILDALRDAFEGCDEP